jgi:hypothetical protein
MNNYNNKQNHESATQTTWENSAYYQLFIKNHEITTLKTGIDNIIEYLNIPDDAKILDANCQQGVCSLHLSKLGYHTTGIDSSSENIKKLTPLRNDNLHFYTHNICEPVDDRFDMILHCFSNFEYLQNDNEIMHALHTIKNSLTTHGFALIDCTNTPKNSLEPETLQIDNIIFNITKTNENGMFKNRIEVIDGDQKFIYTQNVRKVNLSDFEAMFEKAEIYLLDVFGDYKLKKYYPNTSERLIMIIK